MQRAALWNDGELMLLPESPDGATPHSATGVSADGSVVVGEFDGHGAFIWDAVHGTRDLQQVLRDVCGLDLAGWSLRSAYSISADGLTITGWGANSYDRDEAFVAHLPEPGTFTLASFSLAMFMRRRR